MDEKTMIGRFPCLEDVPPEIAECLLERMKLGWKNYGSFDQWKQRMARPGYRRKRLRNTLEHLENIIFDNFEEDDLYGNIGGILFGCMVLLEFHRIEGETLCGCGHLLKHHGVIGCAVCTGCKVTRESIPRTKVARKLNGGQD